MSSTRLLLAVCVVVALFGGVSRAAMATTTTATMLSEEAGCAGGVCCGGFACPHENGVCCADGVAYCCPSGSVCLASGGPVAPQCGTPTHPSLGAGLGEAGGTPALSMANRETPPLAPGEPKTPDEFSAGEEVGGAVEWRVVLPASQSDSQEDEEAELRQLGPEVAKTNHTVEVELRVRNYQYTYYAKHSPKVNLKLREDIARNENLAVHSVEIDNVSPMREATEGKSSKKSASVSGIKVFARIYVPSKHWAEVIARHLFLTLDGQAAEPFLFTQLLTEPPEARGNPRLAFDVSPRSRVSIDGKAYSDRNGIRVARTAKNDAKEVTADMQAARLAARRLAADERREAKRLEREDKKGAARESKEKRAEELRLEKIREQERRADEADEKHKAEVLRRDEELKKREATATEEEKTKQAKRDEETQKREAAAANTDKRVHWLDSPHPVEFTKETAVCAEGTHRVPQWTRAGGLCVVSGRVCATGETVKDLRRKLATLPRSCRPKERRILDRHDLEHRTWRLDAYHTGELSFNGGETHDVNASLDGLVFAASDSPVNSTKPLELLNGWKPVGGQFGPPSVFKQNSFCALSGAVQTKTGDVQGFTDAVSVIAKLPEACRPDGRLVFQVNHHQYSLRIDVLPNGDVEYVDGRKEYKWVSLDGIAFFAQPKAGEEDLGLELLNGYKAFGLGYRKPTLVADTNLCALTGVVDGSQEQVIAKLPIRCRPISGRLSFWLNQGHRSFQVDVHQDGTVERQLPLHDGWLSLDGIVFASGVPADWEVDAKKLAQKK